MAGKPRPGFYFAVFMVIVGLVAFALWRFGAVGGGDGDEGPRVALDELKELVGGQAEEPGGGGCDQREREPHPDEADAREG